MPCCEIYNICKSKIYYNNSINNRKEEMEVCHCKSLSLYMKWYYFAQRQTTISKRCVSLALKRPVKYHDK